ncbi:MAG: fumarylacetoacetate hydrolase family protein [Pseudomonadota bacterium]
MPYVISAPQAITLPVVGSEDLFPVGTVYCIGRNYAAHAREMGHDPDREPPFFFLKATSCICHGPTISYPRLSEDVHHEVELVVALGQGGSDLSEGDAANCIWGYGVGLDLTRRDLQAEAKAMGRPWDVGKSFPGAAPCSAIRPKSDCVLRDDAGIRLEVNGQSRQSGRIDQMIWRVNEQISYLSRAFDLVAGDLIFTGTPAGVGPVVRGDRMVGSIEGVGQLAVRVV